MKTIDNRHKDVMQTLSKGVLEFKNEGRANMRHRGKNVSLLMADYPHVQTALDKFFSNRIGTSFLIRQHISLRELEGCDDCGNYIGLINRQTDLSEVVMSFAMCS